MAFAVTAVAQDLRVEGRSDQVGEFSGRVVAIGVQDADPLASTTPETPSGPAEGLEGWGQTYFLVADEGRDAPVWVAKADVTSHRVD